MNSLALLGIAGGMTALATGLGAVPVFLMGDRARLLRPLLWGVTVGLMSVAAVVGLLLPALAEGEPGPVAAGLIVGVVFLLASRRLLAGRDVHVGQLRGAGVRGRCWSSVCCSCTASPKASRSAPPTPPTPKDWRYS